MEEQDPKDKDLTEGKADYVPSSPARRIVAWVGVAYMVILVLLNFYALSTGGWIRGIGPLMLCPAVLGLAAVTFYNYRSGKGRGGLPAAVFIMALCVLVFVVSLVTGLPTLIQQLGGVG